MIIAAVASLVACGGKGGDKAATTTQKEAEKVKVLTLESERIAKTLELSSTLEGYETMNISPSITGHIEHIYVEVGSRVQKGSMLVRMDQTQLNTTRINLASTKTELDRVTALKASGSVSQQVYDQTKAGYDQLVETERFQNENTFVKAQFAGVISAKNYEDGEMYTGAPILTLTQISRLKAIINIPETYFPKVKQGMKVDVVSDIYPGETFPATIECAHTSGSGRGRRHRGTLPERTETHGLQRPLRVRGRPRPQWSERRTKCRRRPGSPRGRHPRPALRRPHRDNTRRDRRHESRRPAGGHRPGPPRRRRQTGNRGELIINN